MSAFGISWTKTGADSVMSLCEVLPGSSHRGRLYDLMFACTTAPADAVFSYMARRVTGSATGTAVTPAPLDLADAAAVATSKHLITGDHSSGTNGTELLRVPLNHRATFRWVAAPGGELVYPGTANSGICVGLSAVSTNTFAGSIHFIEQ